MILDDDSLPDLARGCAILGAGGGAVDLALQMARHAVGRHGSVEVLGIGQIDEGDLILPCGLVGAPSIAEERIPSGDEAASLRAAVEARWGAPAAALMPFEIGGSNGLMPVVWAARLGLPLVDADTMGRSFPSLTQLALELAGVRQCTWLLTDGRENVVVVDAADCRWADRLVRGAAASLGGLCAAALGGLRGAEARPGVIEGSISRALVCGAARDGTGVRLLDGRVANLVRRLDGTRVHGSATIHGSGGDDGRWVRVELQDEYLLVLEEGGVRAAVPDVIALLAVPSGTPIPTERLRLGQCVRIVALPAPEAWRSAAGLALAGPGAFGLAVAHAPIAAEAAHAAT
jgi:DUF917 family protein